MAEHLAFRPDPVPTLDHPAVRAWAELDCGPLPNMPVESLLTRRGKPPSGKSLIYRLLGVGVSDGAVIAKRSNRHGVMTEKIVYQEILPVVPVPSLHCYGTVGDRSGDDCWLFLDEAQGVSYQEGSVEHAALAAEWLGVTHTTTSLLDIADVLPDHGPDRYQPCLQSALKSIVENISNPALVEDHVSRLETIVQHFETLESRWSEIENRYADMPRCLVHADFVGKNVRVGCGDDGPALYVFDWDIAGWGAPAVDIERLAPEAYWRVVRRTWPHLDLEHVRSMANVGVILRNVGLIEATCVGLAYEWVEGTMQELGWYESQLAEAFRLEEWE